MNETVLTKARRKNAADYEALAAKWLAEIASLEEQMDRDHAESERLKAETQIIKASATEKLLRLQAQINRLSGAA